MGWNFQVELIITQMLGKKHKKAKKHVLSAVKEFLRKNFCQNVVLGADGSVLELESL